MTKCGTTCGLKFRRIKSRTPGAYGLKSESLARLKILFEQARGQRKHLWWNALNAQVVQDFSSVFVEEAEHLIGRLVVVGRPS